MHIIFLQLLDQQMWLSLLLVSLTLLFFFKWLFKPGINRRKNKPPSPSKLPILGNLHQISSLAHHSLHTLSSKHGPVMLLHFGCFPTLIISSAEAAKEIMKTHDLIFASRPESSLLKRLLYDMKTTSAAPYGEYWRQLKSICVLQLLSNKKVQSFQSLRLEETENLMKRVEDSSALGSKSVDLTEMFTSLTNSVVCRAAFGKKYNEGERGRKLRKLFQEFLEVLGTISIGEFIPWLSWINRFNGFDDKVDKIAKDVDEFLEGVVRERLDHDHLGASSQEDFLDILIRLHKDNSTGLHLDIVSIKALLLDVFSAGTDTTASVLEWAMSELLKHPQVMEKVKKEIKEVLNDEKDIKDSDLGKMHYLKCVIKETLRLHPPIPLLVQRVASADVKIMGYDIGIGTRVMINAWAIGREAEYWDEPEEFKPERFMESSVDFMGHDFQFIPFGAGRRGCPGISFAMATNELVLANLVHRFDWKLPDGVQGEDLDMTERPSITISRKLPLLAQAEPCC